MANCRILTQADYTAYDAFLQPYTITSMFLRSNARRVGLDWKEEKFHAHYFGAFDGEMLTGVLALNWNGNIFVQAPNDADLHALLAFAAQSQPDFLVKGLLGPDNQCQKVLTALAITKADCNLNESEDGYRLPLADIKTPPLLASGAVTCRRATEADVPVIARFDIDYDMEALGTPRENTDDMVQSAADERAKIAEGNSYVLEANGQVVARSLFNATLPDTVQIGGVYTPPVNRGKGYARCVVAGSLLIARQEGVREAILFTEDPAAVKAYESIGFIYETDYHLTLLHTGKPLSAG